MRNRLILIVFGAVSGLCCAQSARLETDATAGVVRAVQVSVRVKVPTPEELGEDARGAGVILIPEGLKVQDDFSWDEPNAPGVIGVGLDVHNPVPDKSADEDGRVMGWFDGDGNWYDRPQREVSVHVDGRERINVCSDVEFRTGSWVDVDVRVRYELGGARVSVSIDGVSVIDGMVWNTRPAKFKAQAGVVGEGIEIADLAIVRETALGDPIPEPVSIGVFDEALLVNGATLTSDVDFSGIPESVGRVVATLTLSEPEMGYDHWDKKGTVGIRVPTGVDDEGNETYERFEVFRFITPYRRGWMWSMDVTDLLPLFKDARTLETHIGTYMKGWLVSFRLDFYEGSLEREPIKVVNLWNGEAEIGNPESPVEGFYVPREVEVPEGATGARVRATVTGHGMFPNSMNAGEFMPIWRTMTISPVLSEDDEMGDVIEGDFMSMSARDHLWKTDCYLNPCRPQGGTWKFDRSGWAPGDKVEPWIVDAQHEFTMTDVLRVEYELDPYLNEGRGETWAPHHWTDTVLVFYR